MEHELFLEVKAKLAQQVDLSLSGTSQVDSTVFFKYTTSTFLSGKKPMDYGFFDLLCLSRC